MYYQYRWRYAMLIYVVVVSAAFFLDIQPLRQQYEQLRDVLYALHQNQHDSTLLKGDSDKSVLSGDDEKLLLALLVDINVRLLSLQHESGEYQLQVAGNYISLSTLLKYVFQHGEIFTVESVSVKYAEDDKLVLALRLMLKGLINYQRQQIVKADMAFASPFCWATDASVSVAEDHPDFPLQQMQALGWLQKHGIKSVLLQWPNGLITMHRDSDVVGTDRATIIDINQKGVVLHLADNRKQFFSYQS